MAWPPHVRLVVAVHALKFDDGKISRAEAAEAQRGGQFPLCDRATLGLRNRLNVTLNTFKSESEIVQESLARIDGAVVL